MPADTGPVQFRVPRWRARADAWFKLLGSIVLGYLIVAQGIALLQQFNDAFAIAIGGVVAAALVLPIIRRLNTVMPLWASLTVVYASLALGVAAALYLVLPAVATEAEAFLAALPGMVRAYEHAVRHAHNPLAARLSPGVIELLAGLPDRLTRYLQSNVTVVTGAMTAIALTVTAGFALAIVIPVVSLYMLAESTAMLRFFLRNLQERHRSTAVEVVRQMGAVLGGFIRGQLVVAGSVAVLAISALFILHVPYALLIGIWAGVADIVPYVGPFAGAVPALLVSFSTSGWHNALFVALAFTFINQIEAHVLGPRVVGRTVHISPLAVIFALIIGAHLFGFLGLIVAVPIAGMLRVALEYLNADTNATDANAPEEKPEDAAPPPSAQTPAALPG